MDVRLDARRNCLILVFVLFSFPGVIVSVQAQTVQTTVTVGIVTRQPSIDGVWERGEWDNAVSYNVTAEATSHAETSSTIRLLHDNTTLYGLIDVPSDSGSSHSDSNGHVNWGSVMLTFQDLANASQPFTWISLLTNYKQVASVGLVCQCSTQLASVIKLHIKAATGLTTTSFSNATHRIWEFSAQLYPYIATSQLTQDVSSIGFNVQVSDSAGNQMSLLSTSQLAQLSFAATPLPDLTNIPFLLPFSMLLSILLLRKRRKYAHSERA
jgi:hypothetical protein